MDDDLNPRFISNFKKSKEHYVKEVCRRLNPQYEFDVDGNKTEPVYVIDVAYDIEGNKLDDYISVHLTVDDENGSLRRRFFDTYERVVTYYTKV